MNKHIRQADHATAAAIVAATQGRPTYSPNRDRVVTMGPLLKLAQAWPFWIRQAVEGLPGRVFVRTFQDVREFTNQAAPETCAECGNDCGPWAYCRTPGGTFAYCSDTCFRIAMQDLEAAQ